MSLAVVLSRAHQGVQALPVQVEVHLAGGLPGFSIVGLPEMAVRESKDRVRGALQNCGFELPPRRITINLAPADLPKEGSGFDLPIALGILAASGQLRSTQFQQLEFLGELALSGALRPVHGILPSALAAARAQHDLCIASDNADEAALANGLRIFPAPHLLALCAHLNGSAPIVPLAGGTQVQTTPALAPDMAEIRGQQQAKRALEIAAAGAHSLLMVGPPGTGKSMLASRLPGILPPMSAIEALESASVLSISDQGFAVQQWGQRPFRTPHHSASAPALVGGGGSPRPGEISLAHHGVLFLDELPEFDRKVLEVLREPLETGRICISRAKARAEYPARFQLVAAMNPCPCGYLGDPEGRCHCSTEQVQRYRGRISGPLLDRIDMHIEVPRVPLRHVAENIPDGQTSEQIRVRVMEARHQQLQRTGKTNSALTPDEINLHCALGQAEMNLLLRFSERLGLSARAYHRVLRLARTIADLEHQTLIGAHHLTEALGFRRGDLRSRASS